jgi:hypothetical protein
LQRTALVIEQIHCCQCKKNQRDHTGETPRLPDHRSQYIPRFKALAQAGPSAFADQLRQVAARTDAAERIYRFVANHANDLQSQKRADGAEPAYG